LECQTANYRTIGAAIHDAGAGDQIQICPGVYPEQIIIDKRLRLSGQRIGSRSALIRPSALAVARTSMLAAREVTGAIIVDSPYAVVEGLDVDLSANTTGT